MQTPGEKHLIKKVAELIKASSTQKPQLLNIGANTSVILEDALVSLVGTNFIADRLDISDCAVTHPVAGKSFITSVESMPAVPSNHYEIAFANFVLEHVQQLETVAGEITRVLKPGGYFVTSIPNSAAPEFLISKYTPHWFHQFMRGHGEGSHAHETHYAYKNVKHFTDFFGKYFEVVEVAKYANTLGYLYKFPIIKWLSKVYDKIVDTLHITPLMGHACITFKKKEST